MSTATARAAAPPRSSRDQTSRRFYPQLDGLRAVAVLLVLMHHMNDLPLPRPLAYMSSLGWSGVDAFFVLSGFLITKILLESRPGPRAFGLFVLRRTLRTWPLYFALLIVAWLALRHGPSGMQTNWLRHVFFLQNYDPWNVTRTLGPTWSLCIEEHFYFIWPFFVFLLPRRALYWVLPVVFCLLPVVRWWGLHQAFTTKQLYTETQFHLDGLVAGSLVALLFAWFSARPRTMTWAAHCCLISGIGTALLGFRHGWGVDTGHNVVFGFTSLAAAFSGLLLLLLRGESSILIKAFSFGPLCYVGRISYGIYLLHEGLIPLLSRVPIHRVLGEAASSWILVVLLRMAFAIGVAALSYRFFESPILRLKDRLR
jgi:peptidoglycan/LPS O-acetylase OafA/YrhL